MDAKAYYGAADHPYNTVRPILHEPGPIANGTFTSAAGIPITAGEVLERTAYHDNSSLHVAAMGFWVLYVARDESVTRCAPLPNDIAEVTRPPKYDRRAPYVYDRQVPQLFTPSGRWRSVGRVLPVGDQYFRPARLTSKAGERITWRFAGVEPHSVTVANGPRGFSSNYLGQAAGVLVHADRSRHLSVDLPDPPDDDGPDVEGDPLGPRSFRGSAYEMTTRTWPVTCRSLSTRSRGRAARSPNRSSRGRSRPPTPLPVLAVCAAERRGPKST